MTATPCDQCGWLLEAGACLSAVLCAGMQWPGDPSRGRGALSSCSGPPYLPKGTYTSKYEALLDGHVTGTKWYGSGGECGDEDRSPDK